MDDQEFQKTSIPQVLSSMPKVFPEDTGQSSCEEKCFMKSFLVPECTLKLLIAKEHDISDSESQLSNNTPADAQLTLIGQEKTTRN